MKSYDFLFWAYNVIWFGLAAFLLFVLLRIRGAEKRLDRVEGAMRQDGEKKT